MTKPSILSPARGPPSGVCHFQDSETEYEWKKCDSLLGGCYPRIDSSTLMITLRDFLRGQPSKCSRIPYETLPKELCEDNESGEIDLAQWSLLVANESLRVISDGQASRIHHIATRHCNVRIREYAAQLNLAEAVHSVDETSGEIIFVSNATVSKREKQSLEKIRAMAYEAAYEKCMASSGIQKLNLKGSIRLGDAGIAALVKECRNLIYLDISGSRGVTDTGIRLLGSECIVLETLRALTLHKRLSGCQNILDAGLAVIGQHCHRLTELSISQCKNVGGVGLRKLFEGCQMLQKMDLSNCINIEDQDISMLGAKCFQLLWLSVNSCGKVTNKGIVAVTEGCKGLRYLVNFELGKLGCSQIQWHYSHPTTCLSISHLNCKDVSIVGISYRITDESLLGLGQNCPSLEVFEVLGRNPLSDVGLEWLCRGCKNIKILDLSHCSKITNSGLCSISQCLHDLTWLSLQGLKIVSDVGLGHLATGCLKLEHLDATSLHLMQDGEERAFAITGLQKLAAKCKGIKSLKLNFCLNLSKMSLRAIGKGLKGLVNLSMVNCPNVTEQGLQAVAGGCSALESINFNGCGMAITDQIIVTFAKSCSNLQSIRASGCNHITGRASFEALCSFCRNISYLDLTNCSAVSDYAMIHFSENGAPMLSHILMSGCSKVTNTGIEWLVSGCPNLVLLNLKGTKVTLTSLKLLHSRYPISELVVTKQFFGLQPRKRHLDQLVILDYHARWESATMLQRLFRGWKARKYTTQIRINTISVWLATRVLHYWRRKKTMNIFNVIRLEKQHQWVATVRIQSIWRRHLANDLVNQRRYEYLQCLKISKATYIQSIYRRHLARQATYRMIAEQEHLEKIKVASCITLQKHVRGRQGRLQCISLKEAEKEYLRVTRAAAHKIERAWRNRRTRCKVHILKELQQMRLNVWHTAAMKIQAVFRRWHCRNVISSQKFEQYKRWSSACHLQAHWRGYRQRMVYTMQLRRYRIIQEESAALRLQSAWQRYKALGRLRLLMSTKTVRERLEQEAAKSIQRPYRNWRVQQAAWKKGEPNIMEVVKMAKVEYWGASTIQALFCGFQGRKRAREFRLKYMGRWKEMYDEEKGTVFYYNKIDGEVRWRCPQDFLELLPHSICGECDAYEASLECAECGEFFCDSCWSKLHGGGKRRMHAFRSLYDYYGKRIDYGDEKNSEGEWPSLWYSDIIQDDLNGWSNTHAATVVHDETGSQN